MSRLETRQPLTSLPLEEKIDLPVVVKSLLNQLQQQLIICQSLPIPTTLEPAALSPPLRILLQHLSILLATVERCLLSDALKSEIFAAAMPVIKLFVTHRYGNLALRYHDYFIELSDKFPLASKSHVGDHFAERAKLKTQIFTDQSDEKNAGFTLATPGMLLSALRDLHHALQLAIREKDTSKITNRKTELDRLEVEFTYQNSSNIWLQQQRQLASMIPDEKLTAVQIAAHTMKLKSALSALIDYFNQSNHPHHFAWHLLFSLHQQVSKNSASWQELLLSLLLKTSQHNFGVAASTKFQGKWQDYQKQLITARQGLAANLEQKSELEFNVLPLTLWQSTTQSYSTQIKKFLLSLFEDCNHFLGPPPSSLKFCLVAVGSLARQEILPYSDVEFFCLLDKAEHANWEEGTSIETRYLRAWYDFLQFKMASLGEFTGFRLDGDGFIGGHPLNPELRGRPTHFMQKHIEKNFDKPDTFTRSLLSTDYLYGDKTLYLDYQSQLRQFLAISLTSELTRMQKFAITSVKIQSLAFAVKDPVDEKIIKVKEHYWHPFTQSLQLLAQYHTKDFITNTQVAIDALAKAKLLTTTVADEYRQAHIFLYQLRWQLHQQAQKQVEQFETQEILLKTASTKLQHIYYSVLLPLQQALITWNATQTWEIDPLQKSVNLILEEPLKLQENFLPIIAYTTTSRTASKLNESELLHYHQKTYVKIPRSFRARYLDLLAMELKTDAPSKRLLAHLTITPDAKGWRLQNDRTQQAWREQLQKILHTPAKADADFCILSETLQANIPTPITKYELPTELRQQLLDIDARGKWQFKTKPKNQPGRHTVLKVKLADQYFAVKIVPEQPGTEEAVRILAERVSGEAILPNWLVALQDKAGNSFALQFFPYVENTITYHLGRVLIDHPNYLNQLEPDCFTRLLLRVLLINPEDDKEDDYIILPIEQDDGSICYRLIRIDNERAFFPIEEVQSGDSFLARSRKTLQVKSILYCCNQMQEPLNAEVIDEFLALDPYALLYEWLEILQRRHQTWQQLFDEKSIRQQASYVDPKTKQPMPGFPVIMLPPDIEKELLNRLTLMQYQLRQHRQLQIETEATTIIDLTGLTLLKTVQPVLAEYYESTFTSFLSYDPKKSKPEDALIRFSRLVDDKKNPLYQKTVLGHHQSSAASVTAITKSLRLAIRFSIEDILAIWQGKHLSCAQALKRLIALGTPQALNLIRLSLLQQQETAIKIFQALPLRQKIILIDEFHAELEKSKGECYNTEQQQFLLRAYQGTPFTRLVLSGFHRVLTDVYLVPLLKASGKHLTYLDLSGCQLLKESTLGYISQSCPNLRELILQKSPWIGLEQDNGLLRQRSEIVFPELRRLNISDSTKLQRLKIQAPYLKIININYESCDLLGIVHQDFSSSKFIINNPKIKNENNDDFFVITERKMINKSIKKVDKTRLRIVLQGSRQFRQQILLACRGGSSDSPFNSGPAIATKVIVNNTPYTLEIWDTPTSERYSSMLSGYAKGASMLLLFFYEDDNDSLEKIYTSYINLDCPLLPFIFVDISSTEKLLGHRKIAQETSASAYYHLKTDNETIDKNDMNELLKLAVTLVNKPYSFWDDSSKALSSLDQFCYQAMIHLALMFEDNEEKIATYLKVRKIDWELAGSQGRTLFLQAAYCGQAYWMKKFLGLYDAKKLWAQKNRNNLSIIHLALSVFGNRERQDEVIDFVLEQNQADFKIKGENGRTIFLEAAYRKRLDWMKRFLQVTDPKLLWSQRDNDGQTAVHYALTYYPFKVDNEIIEFVIEREQVDFLARGKDGRTVFLSAAYFNQDKWIQRFLGLADPIILWTQQDVNSNTAVNYAQRVIKEGSSDAEQSQKAKNIIALYSKYKKLLRRPPSTPEKSLPPPTDKISNSTDKNNVQKKPPENKTKPPSPAIFSKPTTLQPPILQLRDEKNQPCGFIEIKTKADGNCLFESTLGGLQQHHLAALKCFNIKDQQQLRHFVADQLQQRKDQPAGDMGHYRRLVALLLKDQIPTTSLSSAAAAISLVGYSPEIRNLLLTLREGYLASAATTDQEATIELLENAFPQYIKHLRGNHHWGGEIELRIISECFKIRVVVYKQHQTQPIAVFGNYRDAVYLYHRDGDTHYHRLEPAPVPKSQRRYSLFTKAPEPPQPAKIQHSLVRSWSQGY